MMRLLKSTEKQREDIEYCEQWLNIEFEGNINSFDDCSQFLKAYLQDAILIEKELNSNYEHYWDNFN